MRPVKTKAGTRQPEAVVLLSGGMDSAVLLRHVTRGLGRRALAVSFSYGQKHSRELECAAWQARTAGAAGRLAIDLSPLAPAFKGSALTDPAVRVPELTRLARADLSQPPTYVPNRNMIFLAIAAALAESRGIGEVYYGAHRGDRHGYWDCTPDFVRNLNRTLALNRKKPVRIVAPFARMAKSAIVIKGVRLGIDYSRTWSCYRGGLRPCGVCPTCVERAAAFAAAGIADPLQHAASAVQGAGGEE